MAIEFRNGINIVGFTRPTPTPTPTPSVTPTVTPTITITPSPTPTITPTNTVTPTDAPLTQTPTPSNTPTNTITPTITSTPTPSVTPTNTITPTNSVTPTTTSTPTVTPTVSVSPTITITPTPTITPTVSVSPTITITPTKTVTPTPSITPTKTPTSGTSTDALLFYDPGNTSSYPGTGTSLTNIGTAGNVTGTLGTMSGVVYDSSTAGGVFNFDGIADKITFGQYNFGNTITVSAWVYPRTEASINCLMANSVANTNSIGFKMSWNNWNTTNYTMNFEAGNATIGNTSSTAINTIGVNGWQMITFVFDKTTPSIKFYKNGTEIATASGGAPVANIGMNNTNWWMGSIGGNSYYMNANMGTFKLWNTIRTAQNVLDEYNNTKSRYGL